MHFFLKPSKLQMFFRKQDFYILNERKSRSCKHVNCKKNLSKKLAGLKLKVFRKAIDFYFHKNVCFSIKTTNDSE